MGYGAIILGSRLTWRESVEGIFNVRLEIQETRRIKKIVRVMKLEKTEEVCIASDSLLTNLGTDYDGSLVYFSSTRGAKVFRPII